MIEKAPNVRIQHPVHFLPRDPDTQRIQRLMLAASWSEPVRETPKVLLIDLLKNRGYSLLNDFVLQGSHP